MASFTYDQPLVQTITIKGASLTSAAELFDGVGPALLQGRVLGMCAGLTTATTVAASNVAVGITGTLQKFTNQVIPVQLIDTIVNTITTDSVSDTNLMPADTRFVISTAGDATAGVADLTILIGWF